MMLWCNGLDYSFCIWWVQGRSFWNLSIFLGLMNTCGSNLNSLRCFVVGHTKILLYACILCIDSCMRYLNLKAVYYIHTSKGVATKLTLYKIYAKQKLGMFGFFIFIFLIFFKLLVKIIRIYKSM